MLHRCCFLEISYNSRLTTNTMLLIIVVFSVLVIVLGKERIGQVIKEDLPHIACAVCERTVTEIFNAVEEARGKKSKHIIDELEITEIIESVSNPKNELGEWMRRIDIVEILMKDKQYLNLIEPGGTGKCLNECATIAKSCQNMIHEDVDVDELSAFIWKNKLPVDELKTKVCTKLTRRCKPRRKELSPTYHRIDEEFHPISEKDLEMERMMESMREMGMGGSLYSRDDLGDMMGGVDEYDSDSDGYSNSDTGLMNEDYEL